MHEKFRGGNTDNCGGYVQIAEEPNEDVTIELLMMWPPHHHLVMQLKARVTFNN